MARYSIFRQRRSISGRGSPYGAHAMAEANDRFPKHNSARTLGALSHSVPAPGMRMLQQCDTQFTANQYSSRIFETDDIGVVAFSGILSNKPQFNPDCFSCHDNLFIKLLCGNYQSLNAQNRADELDLQSPDLCTILINRVFTTSHEDLCEGKYKQCRDRIPCKITRRIRTDLLESERKNTLKSAY